MKMRQYGQGKNPIMRKDVTGDGVYTKKDLLVERGVDGFTKGMDNKKKSPAELGRLKKAFGGALSKLGLGRRGKKSSGGRRGFGGGAINALGSLAGGKMGSYFKGHRMGKSLVMGGLGMKSFNPVGPAASQVFGKSLASNVGRVAKGAANLFNRNRRG